VGGVHDLQGVAGRVNGLWVFGFRFSRTNVAQAASENQLQQQNATLCREAQQHSKRFALLCMADHAA